MRHGKPLKRFKKTKNFKQLNHPVWRKLIEYKDLPNLSLSSSSRPLA